MKRKILTCIMTCMILFTVSFTSVYAKPYTMNNTIAKQIIQKQKHIHIDKIKCIDKYVAGRWYCYYVKADGDIYITTIKKSKVQKFVILN